MPLFNPKTLEAALQAFDFAPSDAQRSAASHWAGLMRDEFLLSQKETALEGDFTTASITSSILIATRQR
jgi:hypothetical protein